MLRSRIALALVIAVHHLHDVVFSDVHGTHSPAFFPKKPIIATLRRLAMARGIGIERVRQQTGWKPVPPYARIGRSTVPATSVSRNGRPL